jgi:hypothetical protein
MASFPAARFNPFMARFFGFGECQLNPDFSPAGQTTDIPKIAVRPKRSNIGLNGRSAIGRTGGNRRFYAR